MTPLNLYVRARITPNHPHPLYPSPSTYLQMSIDHVLGMFCQSTKDKRWSYYWSFVKETPYLVITLTQNTCFLKCSCTACIITHYTHYNTLHALQRITGALQKTFTRSGNSLVIIAVCKDSCVIIVCGFDWIGVWSGSCESLVNHVSKWHHIIITLWIMASVAWKRAFVDSIILWITF